MFALVFYTLSFYLSLILSLFPSMPSFKPMLQPAILCHVLYGRLMLFMFPDLHCFAIHYFLIISRPFGFLIFDFPLPIPIPHYSLQEGFLECNLYRVSVRHVHSLTDLHYHRPWYCGYAETSIDTHIGQLCNRYTLGILNDVRPRASRDPLESWWSSYQPSQPFSTGAVQWDLISSGHSSLGGWQGRASRI